jgi:hypothetical protein
MEKQRTLGSWVLGREEDRWKSHRRTAGWLNVVIGLLGVVGFTLVLVTGGHHPIPAVSVLAVGSLPLLHAVGGIGLLRGVRWLRAPLWPISVIDLVAFPLGSVLGCYNLWVLYNTRASAGSNPNEPGAAPQQRRTPIWGWSLLVLCVVIILGAFGGNRAFEQGREEFRREVDAMAGLLDSSGIHQPDLEEPIPESESARMMWAVRMSTSDLFGFYRSSAAGHGFDFDAGPPDEWMQSEYLANATRYSTVRVYFANYLQWIEDVYPEALPQLEGFMRQRISQAGLNSAQVLTDMETAFQQRRAGIEAMQQVEEQFVRAALQLHDFLVEVDTRVDYDGTNDIALFQVEDELSAANRLIGDVNELSARLDSLQGGAYLRASEFIDKWGSKQRDTL